MKRFGVRGLALAFPVRMRPLCALLALIAVHAGGAEPQVVFGGSVFYPPFHFLTSDGQANGFDSEVFRAVAIEAGWNPAFRFAEWDSVQQELQNGLIDVVPMFVSDARSRRYLFSDPIEIEFHLLFGRTSASMYRSLDSIGGLRVATETGAYARDELLRLGTDAVLIAADSEAEALRMVARGQADLALIPSRVGYYTLRQEQLTDISAVSPPLLPVPYAFGINPARGYLLEGFNAALAELQRQGVLEELRDKWLATSTPISSWQNPIVGVLLLLVLGALVGLRAYRQRFQRSWQIVKSQQQKLHSAERKFREIVIHDPLTGLFTRDHFTEQLEAVIENARADCRLVAVSMIQLRDLDYVQHNLGHRMSEALLRQIADLITGELDAPAAYTGSGRFLLMIAEAVDEQKALTEVARLVGLCSGDFVVEDMHIEVQVAAGLALYPRDATDASTLIRKAAFAKTRAQELFVPWLVYSPSMDPDPGNIRLMSDLRQALKVNGLSWAYQPQYCTTRERIIGAEMLARWEHPEHGWVPPDRFIVMAEQSGLIRHITAAAIRNAVLTLQQWRAEGLDYELSLNVSANDLSDAHMVEAIIRDIEGYANRLTLEITETALMQDVGAILRSIELLKQARVRISLDDYGTGYSSMEYLRKFCFDEIKIDRTFIRGITCTERDLKLTTSSIRLGHDLGAKVVAEGVEDVETAALLIDAGCDVLQGYLISRPLPLDKFKAFTSSFDMKQGISFAGQLRAAVAGSSKVLYH